MIVTASDSVLHPAGKFLSRIIAVEDTNRSDEGTPEKVFTIETQPMNGDGPTRSIRHQAYCPQAETPQLFRMFQTVCCQNADRKVFTNELIGSHATITVQHYTKDNGRKGHRIASWQPHHEC